YAWRALEPAAVRFLRPSTAMLLADRVDQLTAQRSDMTVTQAAEIRRIERALHAGHYNLIHQRARSYGPDPPTWLHAPLIALPPVTAALPPSVPPAGAPAAVPALTAAAPLLVAPA
ncbi:hypothetical protein VM98_35945, partial [Streptomyces rubellomurinus subsp. indigoferus]